MQHTPIYQVDAFTGHLFGGNPAAVCPLESWLPEETMQAIAAENNLSETAFFVLGEAKNELRWFTPTLEIDLCGHATLASAFVVFQFLRPELSEVRFETRSGQVGVTREGERLELDFPANPATPLELDPAVAEALGCEPLEMFHGEHYTMVVLNDEAAVRGLAPDIGALAGLDHNAFIVTAAGAEADFVSRFFAPKLGVGEDPVTGSAHCMLAPFWAERLGRNPLRALQVSTRVGELFCEVRGDRVGIAGRAVLYLEGRIRVPD